eukprot:COSAG02_NODE_3136_length_7300_cov_4.065269_3_plen_55_part_00
MLQLYPAGGMPAVRHGTRRSHGAATPAHILQSEISLTLRKTKDVERVPAEISQY